MHSGSYQISQVSEEELVKLRDIAIETFGDTFSKKNNSINLEAYLQKAFNEEQLLSELKNPDSYFYFLKNEGSIIGYLKLNTKQAQSDQLLDSALEIERIYLTKEVQGIGLGAKLIHFAMDEARERGLLCIWLGVWEKNEKAIQFYEKHGFEVFDSHPFKLGDDLQKDLLMKRFIY